MISIKILITALSLFINHYNYDDKYPLVSQFSETLLEASCAYVPKVEKQNAAICVAAAVNLCHYLSDGDVYYETGVRLDCKVVLKQVSQ